MKRSIPLILTAALVSLPAIAENDYITRARVVSSTPIVETAYEKREVCSYKYVTERSGGRANGNIGDKVIGGVLGGAAGSAIGKGSGRDAAAGVGVLLGSEVASQDGGLTEGELIGGLAGGIIGNQVGKGSGKTAATAAGVLLGSIVGDNLQNGAQPSAEVTETRRKKRICEVKEFPKKIITGYDVVFEHDNYHFSQILAYDPSDYVEINVNIQVLEDRTGLR